ncbi:MAG: hypothetical protein LBN37_06980, partial [Bacteroidales bacterium]|nr:hypothetical protein [Bacteroidales bacterium]
MICSVLVLCETLLHLPVIIIVEIVLPLVVVGIVVLIGVSKKSQYDNLLAKKKQLLIQQKAQALQKYEALEAQLFLALREHDRLELTHRTKTQLFQVISGDVGNPLILLKKKLAALLVEDIEDTRFKAEVIELSQMVSDMSLLLENLLQWSKYQAQAQRPNPQPNDLSALVQESVNALKFAAADKRI